MNQSSFCHNYGINSKLSKRPFPSDAERILLRHIRQGIINQHTHCPTNATNQTPSQPKTWPRKRMIKSVIQRPESVSSGLLQKNQEMDFLTFHYSNWSILLLL